MERIASRFTANPLLEATGTQSTKTAQTQSVPKVTKASSVNESKMETVMFCACSLHVLNTVNLAYSPGG